MEAAPYRDPAPYDETMENHFNVLGYLFLGYGAVILLVALVATFFLGGAGILADDPEAAAVMAAITGGLWMVLLVIAAPYLLAGYGLLKRRSWARVLSLVLAALALLSVPLGTALGIYAFWALLKPEAQEAFA